MDPSSLVSQAPLPEVWQFPMVGVPPGGPRVGRMKPGPEASAVGNRDGSLDESTVTEQSGGNWGRRKRRDSASEDESSKLVSTSSGNDLTDSEVKRPKIMKSTNEMGNLKMEAEASSGICNKTVDQNPPPPEPPKQDYIHVRARRGQATDSHSLAERARREKISERMKILQDLVPGCNKVIGKASVLDEIINYIQALQRQVEFLSMKLEAVNSRMNTGIEGFPAKDSRRTVTLWQGVYMRFVPDGSLLQACLLAGYPLTVISYGTWMGHGSVYAGFYSAKIVFQRPWFGAQTYDTTSSLAFNTQPAREYGQGSATEWLHMQVGGAFERVT